MRKPAACAALLLLALAAALPGCATRPPEGEPWRLAPGDYWVAHSTGENVTVVARTEIAQLLTYEQVPAIVTHVAAHQVFGNVTLRANTTSWSRSEDLATLAAASYSRTEAPGYPPIEGHALTDYDPPCKGLRFPLRVGSTWTRRCEATVTSSDREEPFAQVTVYRFTVEGEERVEVPAGAFDAFRLRVEGQGTLSYQWVSLRACGVVKSLSLQGTPVTTELQSYRCASGAAAALDSR